MTSCPFFLAFLLLASFCIPQVNHAQTPGNPVRIIATGIHYGGKVIYKYLVINNGEKSISRIQLGMAQDTPNFQRELNLLPAWDSQSTGKIWFSPASVTQPQGWGSSLSHYADGGGGPGIDWIEASYYRRIFPNAQMQEQNAPTVYPEGRMIGPKQSSDAFSVTLSKPDYAYVNTLAIVTYGEDFISVSVEKGDSAPPFLEMNVSPSRKNSAQNDSVILHVHGRATDNADPQPEIELAPVIANEPLEPGTVSVEAGARHWRIKLKSVPHRIYQIRMMATDASGNSSEKTFNYDVDTPNK